MNYLDELAGLIGIAALAAALWCMGTCQETYSHMPPSARPHLENWAH